MFMKNRLSLVILLVFGSLAITLSVSASMTAEIVTNPADEIAVCDQTETVEIQIKDVTDLYGYQIEVSYDETIIEATGSFDNSWFDTTTDALIVDGSCASGSCLFAVSKSSPAGPLSGSGTVVKIDLDRVSFGASDLVIENVVLTDVDGFELSSNLPGSPLSVTACGSITTDPPNHITVCNQTETVDIKINDVTDLYGYQIQLSYDESIVTVSGNFVDSWFDTSNDAFIVDESCSGGDCLFAVSKTAPADSLNGSGFVVSLALSPLSTGTFNLVFENVVLTDIDGFEIPISLPDIPLTVTGCGEIITDPPDELLVCGQDETVNIDLINIYDLYGYEVSVSYDPSLVTATGSFDNTWFDTSGGLIPPGWNADCAAGICQFAVAKTQPTPPSDGSGTIASINLSPTGIGIFDMIIGPITLSDKDGFVITVMLPATPLKVYVADDCGYADILGYVELQGRLTPIDEGNVTFKDNGGNFPDTTTIFSAVDGSYSASVPVLLSGSSYRFEAAHLLYLTNELDPVILNDGDVYVASATQLSGGDANNDGVIDILDVSCIGSAYLVGGDCGGQGNTDINADGITNIQDLSLTGGNYFLTTFQPW